LGLGGKGKGYGREVVEHGEGGNGVERDQKVRRVECC